MDRDLAEDQMQLSVSIDFRQLKDAIYPSISADPNERVFNFGGNVKKTIFGATYHKWIKRLGKKKALIAVARKILELAHFLIKNETDYLEKLPPVVAA